MTIENIPTPEPIATAHECPYAERVVKYRSHMGLTALQSSYLDRVVASLHINNECPPTHTNGPTKEWEEILDYTFF